MVILSVSTNFFDVIINNSRKLIKEGYYDLGDTLTFEVRSTRETFSKAIKNCRDFPVIAELKFKSPNMNSQLQPSIEVVRDRLKSFYDAGVVGFSILTEPTFFHGSLIYLREAAMMFPKLPILMKDFIIDPIQINAAKNYGASTILIIAKVLSRDSINRLIEYAHSLDLEVLLEVNSKEEMEFALSTNAEIIGINNRNLTTFEITLETTERLSPLFLDCPQIILSLSGIHSRTSAYRMKKTGVDGILVGTVLMQSSDPFTVINELREV